MQGAGGREVSSITGVDVSRMVEYHEFLNGKRHRVADAGVEVADLNPMLFPFQRDMTRWALRKGRAAIWADCGLGKTPMQLVWAEAMARHTQKPTLILSPLAVSAQTIHEGEKFGIEVTHSQDGQHSGAIVITNYERLNAFDCDDFGAVVCDESSILKSFDGTRRQEITSFMRTVPYRLLATATAAPNDYIEMGTSSEALGHLGYMDMLTMFFKNDQNNSATRRFFGEALKWRFKGHAEIPFWQWVTSWAMACRKPSDLGYEDGEFVLPPMVTHEHITKAQKARAGLLFETEAVNLREQREERRITIEERCGIVADLVNPTGEPALVWCQLNAEADLLKRLIPDAVEISGSDSDERKESAFLDFADRKTRVLITKPTIGAWGLNFQHCAHVTYFPSHSYEQYYQSVRRCWRFGQSQPVRVDLVMSEGERRVMQNLERKATAAARMFDNLVAAMGSARAIERPDLATKTEELPSWL